MADFTRRLTISRVLQGFEHRFIASTVFARDSLMTYFSRRLIREMPLPRHARPGAEILITNSATGSRVSASAEGDDCFGVPISFNAVALLATQKCRTLLPMLSRRQKRRPRTFHCKGLPQVGWQAFSMIFMYCRHNASAVARQFLAILIPRIYIVYNGRQWKWNNTEKWHVGF